ncbi:DinB family protein [Dyadobacter tibetensis]|uniref:DinB family protein n=1 Tax=Dyadobacter tibetensis TaxID=1211851 RepID=UPI000471AF66|nr:DinB family protein [Dyadobacter tibetensis]
MEELKFPLGRVRLQEDYSTTELAEILHYLEEVPSEYAGLTQNLEVETLKKTYRPGSWNIQQIVHHVADMHLLHMLRMKKALTEPDYKEVTLVNMDGWAATADVLDVPISDSLLILKGIHHRYVALGRSLSDEQYQIQYYHPVRGIYFNQKQALAITAWHAAHHLAHIKIALGLPYK